MNENFDKHDFQSVVMLKVSTEMNKVERQDPISRWWPLCVSLQFSLQVQTPTRVI